MKEKPTVCSPFFGEFPSDHIPIATKHVNIYFYIHIFTFSGELIMDNALKITPENFGKFLKLLSV
jgi:hypothetical protein